jgi:hypothetical protein
VNWPYSAELWTCQRKSKVQKKRDGRFKATRAGEPLGDAMVAAIACGAAPRLCVACRATSTPALLIKWMLKSRGFWPCQYNRHAPSAAASTMTIRSRLRARPRKQARTIH